jgi:hypothetical protein
MKDVWKLPYLIPAVAGLVFAVPFAYLADWTRWRWVERAHDACMDVLWWAVVR